MLLAPPLIPMLVPRTDDGPSGITTYNLSASTDDGSSGGTSAIGINIIVPVILIIVVSVSSALFVLFCRRVLRHRQVPAVYAQDAPELVPD